MVCCPSFPVVVLAETEGALLLFPPHWVSETRCRSWQRKVQVDAQFPRRSKDVSASIDRDDGDRTEASKFMRMGLRASPGRPCMSRAGFWDPLSSLSRRVWH